MRGQRLVVGAAVLGLLLTTMLALGTSGARFTGTAASTGNSAAAAQLLPPTSPSATYNCSLATRTVTVTWTASPSTAATHYRVFESTWNSGTTTWGANTLVATVAYGTNTWTDTSVSGSSQFRYMLQTIRTGTTWVSANSAWSNIVNSPALCV